MLNMFNRGNDFAKSPLDNLVASQILVASKILASLFTLIYEKCEEQIRIHRTEGRTIVTGVNSIGL